jgi:ribonuclease inhibitor
MPMKRKQCTLNGQTLRSLASFYDELSRKLSLPEHFGRNLDALWDVLSTDVEGPFEIIWHHADASKKAMGKDFDVVLKLLQKLKKERKDFKLVVEP